MSTVYQSIPTTLLSGIMFLVLHVPVCLSVCLSVCVEITEISRWILMKLGMLVNIVPHLAQNSRRWPKTSVLPLPSGRQLIEMLAVQLWTKLYAQDLNMLRRKERDVVNFLSISGSWESVLQRGKIFGRNSTRVTLSKAIKFSTVICHGLRKFLLGQTYLPDSQQGASRHSSSNTFSQPDFHAVNVRSWAARCDTMTHQTVISRNNVNHKNVNMQKNKENI